MIVAIVTDDIVIGRGSGIIGPEIGADLLDLPDDRLRLDGDAIIDVGAAVRSFYISENGLKHIEDAPGRFEITCAFDTEIELDGAGGWQVVDQLARLKLHRKAAIDAEAEQQRLRWITPGAGQAMTYSRKVEQAKAVIAATNPQPEDYPMLAASIGIDGATLLDVANLVISMDDAWEQIGAAIEQARLGGKHAVDLAATVEAAEAVAVIWPESAP